MIAFLQARTSSKRLPGKILRPILGVPMILRQIERVQSSKAISKCVVLTSNEPSDDALVNLLKEHKVEYFRGSLDDVLDRFYQASLKFSSDQIVRLTGDCPLCDPATLDATIALHLSGNYDYTSNNNPPSFPDGLDCEVFSTYQLKRAWHEAKLPSEREHVTPYFYKHPELFKTGHLVSAVDLSAHRWTVDQAEDFTLVTQIFEALYPKNPHFNKDDVLSWLKHNPNAATVNAGFEYNEGYKNSLQKDRAYKNKV
jgi:spore coat polysaccharide biosynthesis protein SpsF